MAAPEPEPRRNHAPQARSRACRPGLARRPTQLPSQEDPWAGGGRPPRGAQRRTQKLPGNSAAPPSSLCRGTRRHVHPWPQRTTALSHPSIPGQVPHPPPSAPQRLPALRPQLGVPEPQSFLAATAGARAAPPSSSRHPEPAIAAPRPWSPPSSPQPGARRFPEAVRGHALSTWGAQHRTGRPAGQAVWVGAEISLSCDLSEHTALGPGLALLRRDSGLTRDPVTGRPSGGPEALTAARTWDHSSRRLPSKFTLGAVPEQNGPSTPVPCWVTHTTHTPPHTHTAGTLQGASLLIPARPAL